MSEIREEKSDRGFIHLDEVVGDRGDVIRVYESSAAMVEGENRGPWLWLSIEGTAHVGEFDEVEEYSKGFVMGGKAFPPTRIIKGQISAHLDLDQAIAIRDRLDRMIQITKESWGIKDE